jgi:hypothetical protein
MKHYLLTIVILITIIAFSSCKKSSSSSPYYMKATINGTNVTYNGYTAALKTSGGQLDVYGANNSASTSDGIHFEFFNRPVVDSVPVSDPQVVPGIYTDSYFPGIVGAIPVVYVSLQQSGTAYGGTSPFTVTITSINESSVSGTFSGTAVYNSTIETVTNGSFYVPF